MDPQDPKDVTQGIARDLTGMVGELAALKGEATHWLTGPEHEALRLRLEMAHAVAEASGEAGQRSWALLASIHPTAG